MRKKRITVKHSTEKKTDNGKTQYREREREREGERERERERELSLIHISEPTRLA